MRNDLYHGFTPGFNVWYVLLVVFLILVVAWSLNCSKLSKTKRRILRRDKEDKILNVIVIVFDVILHIFIAFESGAGLVQAILNSLGEDTDPAWVIFLLPVSLMFSVATFYTVLFGAGKLTKYLKEKYLEFVRQ